MDGYAIAGDAEPVLGDSWLLVGRSAPAAPFAGSLAAGEAVRILTGAPLPEGSARVLPQELVETVAEFPPACHPTLEPTSPPNASPTSHPHSATSREAPNPSELATPTDLSRESRSQSEGGVLNANEPERQRLRLRRPAGPNPWIRPSDEEAAPGRELVPQGHRLEIGRAHV